MFYTLRPDFVLTGGAVISEGRSVLACTTVFRAGLYDIIIIVFDDEFFVCWN